MPNGNEHKNPPPPPPPPGGAKPGGAGGAKPNDGNQNPPQNQIRRAAGVGSLIGALIACCPQHLH